MIIYHIQQSRTSRSPLQRTVKRVILIQMTKYGRTALVLILINLKEVFFISKDAPQLNGEIRDKEVRVISDTGEQLGIMSAKDALKLAEAKGVDLVKIAPQAKPPVVKIMDYSKFRYEQSKREKENRKKQKIVETKEIRLSINIDIGDFNTKVNQARKFLSKGDKVKVSIRLRGREMAHADLAENNCMRFAEELAEEANVDKKPKLEGRQVLMFLSPKVSNK